MIMESEAYCTGDRCADCAPDDECCETMCGVCPRVSAAGGCPMQAGGLDGTRSCRQHGMYDILRHT
jgi:hypothetical protein